MIMLQSINGESIRMDDAIGAFIVLLIVISVFIAGANVESDSILKSCLKNKESILMETNPLTDKPYKIKCEILE